MSVNVISEEQTIKTIMHQAGRIARTADAIVAQSKILWALSPTRGCHVLDATAEHLERLANALKHEADALRAMQPA